MKYELNKIPVKTTNSFNINSLKIDLFIPNDFKSKKFKTVNTEEIDIKYIEKEEFNSNIGLKLDKALEVNIDIKESINDPIEFIYDFAGDNLINLININCFENVEANIVFKYISKNEKSSFHHLKQVINVRKNANINVTVVNLLNDSSTSLIASESNVLEDGVLIQNLIDIGGKIKISNYESTTYNGSASYLNNIYLGNNNDIIDMNYHYINNGISSTTNIESQGVLNNDAIKNFRGTIDFISGCSKSVGKENENCVLLSNSCVSRSVPILLCGEENVEGAHSVSSGKIDESKLFYMTSRGLKEEEAKKMILMSNFNEIISCVKNPQLENDLISIISDKI